MLRRPKSILNVSKYQNRKIIFPNSDSPSYTSPSSNSNLFALSYRRTTQKVVNDVRISREFTFYYVMKSVKNCLCVKLFQRNTFCFSTPKSSACVFRYTVTRFTWFAWLWLAGLAKIDCFSQEIVDLYLISFQGRGFINNYLRFAIRFIFLLLSFSSS